jgi:isopropylmalate/homocitrate/citramalate synthase
MATANSISSRQIECTINGGEEAGNSIEEVVMILNSILT